jgi:ABC-2 type transport system permease protein
MNTFKWLLKREYWEHKGGMFWAPTVIAALLLVAALVSVVVSRAVGHSGNMRVNGVQVTSLEQIMPPEKQIAIANGIAHNFIGMSAPLFIAMSFVVFFYLIGALYDDRSNRSVLFWKSLPISDRDTVLSKVASALLVAPLITWSVAAVSSVLLSLLACFGMSISGLNLFGQVLGNPKLYTLPFEFLACLPVYLLWALPTVGWLLMVSAWARTKPFLWAVGVPLLSGGLISWANAMFDLNLKLQHLWQGIGRLLISILPGSWSFLLKDPTSIGADSLDKGSPLASTWNLMAAPELWVGAVVGIVMIVVAIRLRRFRDEG